MFYKNKKKHKFTFHSFDENGMTLSSKYFYKIDRVVEILIRKLHQKMKLSIEKF